MNTVPFLDVGAATRELRTELEEAVARVLASGWYILGAELERFEEEFARYVGVKHCVGVGNGLDALHLALRAMDVGPGDEVVVPANTYVATWLAVSYAGATPVAVDPCPSTLNIDPTLVERAISPRTRAILPVHLYGQPADMTSVREIGRRHGVRVLEDAAQAHGASWDGRRTGSLGDAAAWSFYPSKNLGALGDGGAVTTDDDEIAERVRLMRNYGARTKYHNDLKGYNSRLDELQAAVLQAKLPHLDEWNRRRASVAARYLEALAPTSIVPPAVAVGADPAWHLFVVRCRDREKVAYRLKEAGIQTSIHYPVPPYRQPAYGADDWRGAATPVSDAAHEEVLSLPIGPHLETEQVEHVIEELTRGEC